MKILIILKITCILEDDRHTLQPIPELISLETEAYVKVQFLFSGYEANKTGKVIDFS